MGHCTVFVRPHSRTDRQAPPGSAPAGPSILKWVISLLVCCWRSSSGSSGDSESGEDIELGPMTLREYINTLEPYDPERHGWRGEEPWHRGLHLSNGAVADSGRDSPPKFAYSSVSYQPPKRSSLHSQRNQIV